MGSCERQNRKRSDENELLDNLSLNDNDLRINLNEIEVLNKLFGSRKLLINAMSQIKNKYADYFNKHKIVIVTAVYIYINK